MSKKRSKRLTPYKDAYKLFMDFGIELLDDHFDGYGAKHLCKCVCGEVSYRTLGNVRAGKKCTECRRRGFIGELNPRWNPDLTDEQRNKNRDTLEHIQWRENVFSRDDYTCQECSERGGKLNAHHIVPFSVDVELSLDEENGVTLCETCHKRIHSSGGIALKQMNVHTYAEYMQRDTVYPEIELDYNHETGEMEYVTVFS